ncbi:MAG: AI-2E family transporter [Bacteroidetes bacterium GWF2_49_14]|nr:MAG: AI-2E family transporter [Bacteroidetes bacterium GWF2_49_14]HBB91050.1 AI-2E family transporter [Bacteroidales bacterium]
MIGKEIKIPFFARSSIFLVGLLALIAILYLASNILIPLIFAIMFAIVLHPLVNFIVRFKVNRLLAIIITLLITVVVIAAFLGLMISQVSRFGETWPILVERFTSMIDQSITWASGYFDINPEKITVWISTTMRNLFNSSTAAIGQLLLNIGGILVVALIIPVYVFILLYYHPLLIEFIRRIFIKNDPTQVKEIVSQTKTVIQGYLIGLIIEAVIVAIMQTTVLFILGIDYAILLGILGALLNVIPYLGGIVAVAIPMMVAVATKDSAWYALYVMILYYIIQLIDNNFIVLKIVASKVKINALFSLLVVFIGNAIWGIPGMFLSIPLLAIVKVVFDHIEPLKAWGFLLGDTLPPILVIKPILKKLKIKLDD